MNKQNKTATCVIPVKRESFPILWLILVYLISQMRLVQPEDRRGASNFQTPHARDNNNRHLSRETPVCLHRLWKRHWTIWIRFQLVIPIIHPGIRRGWLAWPNLWPMNKCRRNPNTLPCISKTPMTSRRSAREISLFHLLCLYQASIEEVCKNGKI